MASVQRHCIRRARSCFPSNPAAAHQALSTRSQSIHTTARVQTDEDKGNDRPNRPVIRSLLRNKASYDAINTPTPNDVKNTINRFVSGSGQTASREGQVGANTNVTDARNLGSAGSSAGSGPMIARRRIPPARGSSAPRGGAGGVANTGPRRGGGGAGGGRRGGSSAANRGGQRRGSRRRGGPLNADDADVDALDPEELEALQSASPEESSMSGDPESWFKRDLTAELAAAEAREAASGDSMGIAVSGLVDDLRNPVTALEDIEKAGLSPEAREWALDKLRAKHAPAPHEPEFDLVKDLAGFGPGLNLGGDGSDAKVNSSMSADALYQILGQSTRYKGKMSHKHDLQRLAKRFVRPGDAPVLMPIDGPENNAEEATATLQGYAKQWIGRRRAAKQKTMGDAFKEVAADDLDDLTFHSPSLESRSAVNDYLFAGKYTPPGQAAPKNASPQLKEIYRMAARNASYDDRDEQTLAAKIASMLPVARPAPSGNANANGTGTPAGKQARPAGSQQQKAKQPAA